MMDFVQQNEVEQGLFSSCPSKQSKGTHNTQFFPLPPPPRPPLEPYVIVTHHMALLFPYLMQFSYFSKVFALHLGLNCSKLNASLYYHLWNQTQSTYILLDVSRMNVEFRMSLIASCLTSRMNLSSHASYNWGIWKAIILLFMFRACGPLIYSTITSLVLHQCLHASVNRTISLNSLLNIEPYEKYHNNDNS